jgi:hypothetical protein
MKLYLWFIAILAILQGCLFNQSPEDESYWLVYEYKLHDAWTYHIKSSESNSYNMHSVVLNDSKPYRNNEHYIIQLTYNIDSQWFDDDLQAKNIQAVSEVFVRSSDNLESYSKTTASFDLQSPEAPWFSMFAKTITEEWHTYSGRVPLKGKPGMEWFIEKSTTLRQQLIIGEEIYLDETDEFTTTQAYTFMGIEEINSTFGKIKAYKVKLIDSSEPGHTLLYYHPKSRGVVLSKNYNAQNQLIASMEATKVQLN